jgi:hypothetical protein
MRRFRSLPVSLGLLNFLIFGVFGCSSGEGRKDKHYGTDAGASYKPSDAARLPGGSDSAQVDGTAPDTSSAADGSDVRATADTGAATDASTSGDATFDGATDSDPPHG